MLAISQLSGLSEENVSFHTLNNVYDDNFSLIKTDYGNYNSIYLS